MKKIILPLIVIIVFASCKKASNTSSTDFKTLEGNVINDFTYKTALPQYDSLSIAATALNTSIVNLQANTTDANLAIAQTKWKNIRTVWEQCEGFLIGPVESNDYDPNTDSWPTDHVQLDSLLTASTNLTVGAVDSLTQSLKGYHPMEYVLFRNGESTVRTAASFTQRELQYLTSLSGDIVFNNVQPLVLSWTTAPTNYAQGIITSGTTAGAAYTSRQNFFIDVIGDNGMAGICNEVGEQDAEGKMFKPYTDRDSTITESPYSNNSLIDFKNNIIGAQNVYLGLHGGLGIKDLVAANNRSLDNQIQAQFTSTINSFNNITERYEQAIFDQRTQVAATLAQLQTLKNLLDNDLINYVKQYVKD
jgi:putative iron-regulated protein